MLHADSRTFTVREIAQILVEQEGWTGTKWYREQFDKRLRQVRHWTACNFLTPIGRKHTGTGVARRYGPDEVRKAALLRELTRFGLTVSQLENIGEGFGEELEQRSQQKEWRQAIEASELIFYQIVYEAGSSAGDTTMMMNLVPAERSLIRFLDPNYRKPSGGARKPSAGKKGEASLPPPPPFVSALTISLTRLFATLKV